MRWRAPVAWGLVLGATSCGGGEDCSPTDASCQPADPRYELVLMDAPAALGAFIVEVRAGGMPFALTLSPSGASVETGSNPAGTEWRAVIIGRPAGGTLGTLTLEEVPASLPVATVVEAAAGASQGYAVLTSSMRVEVRRLE